MEWLMALIMYVHPEPYSFKCVEYLSNYDGDTITVNINEVHPIMGKKIPVRIRGIDTPEIRSKCKYEALQAKDYVTHQMRKTSCITLKDVKRGSFFRLVADVWVKTETGEQNLGSNLLKKGLAVKYGEKTCNK